MEIPLPAYGMYDTFLDMFSKDYHPSNKDEEFIIEMFFADRFDIPTLFDIFNNKQLLAVVMKLESRRQ